MEDKKKAKVILITGCSTGMGRAAAVLLATKGHIVYATMRNLDKRAEIDAAAKEHNIPIDGDQAAIAGSIRLVQLDVCNDESVNAAVASVVAKEGRLDVLVNNAGMSLVGSADDLSIDAAKALFDTNVWGIARTVKAVLPQFRKQSEGQIVNISSVGGLIGFPFQEYYCASKFAVEGYTESLAISNRKLNVKVSLVEPAAVKTPFVSNAPVHAEFADAGVADLFAQFNASMKAAFAASTAQSAEDVAEVIAGVIESEEWPRLRYQTSDLAKAIASRIRVDPTGQASLDAQTNRFFPSIDAAKQN